MEYEYNMAVPYYNHMVLGASIIDSSIYDTTGWSSTCYDGDYSVHAVENPYGFPLGPNDTYDLSHDTLLLQQEQKLERLERERLEIERDYCASMKMLLGTQLMELESAKYRQAGTNVVKEATQRRDGYVIIQIEPDDEVLSPLNNRAGEMSSPYHYSNQLLDTPPYTPKNDRNLISYSKSVEGITSSQGASLENPFCKRICPRAKFQPATPSHSTYLVPPFPIENSHLALKVDFENEQPKELTSVSLQIEPDLENSGGLTSNSLPLMSHTPTDENVLVTNFLTITPSKQSDESELDCNNEEILSLICSTTESTCEIIHQTSTRFSFESLDRDLVTKSVSPTPNLTTDTSNFDSNVEFIKWTIPKTKFLKRHEYYKKAESLILCENRFKTLSIEEEYEDEGIEELSNVKSRDKIQDRLDVVKSKSRMIKFRSTSSVDRYSQLVQKTRCRNFRIESVPDLFVNFLSKLDKMPVRVSENEVIEVIFNLLSPSYQFFVQECNPNTLKDLFNSLKEVFLSDLRKGFLLAKSKVYQKSQIRKIQDRAGIPIHRYNSKCTDGEPSNSLSKASMQIVDFDKYLQQLDFSGYSELLLDSLDMPHTLCIDFYDSYFILLVLEYLQLPFISVEIDCGNNNAALSVIRFDMEKVAGYLASDSCSHCLERVSEVLGTSNHTRKLSELRKLSDRSILFGKSVQLAARVTWPMASVSELREGYNRVRKRTKRKADRLRVDDSTAMLSRNTVVPSQNWVGIER
ncbi:hypothetical protein U1Q18_043499, partial [Sarracenia purpurea var. burkii]